MKIKHRALTLLLSLAIVLTFMPALAFAEPLPEDIGSSEWSITNEETVFFMEGSSQTIQVTTTLDGTGAELSYQWYVGDDEDDEDEYDESILSIEFTGADGCGSKENPINLIENYYGGEHTSESGNCSLCIISNSGKGMF